MEDPNMELKGWILLGMLVLVYFMMSQPVSAQESEDWLVINNKSYHFDRTKGYVEDNFGLFWERKTVEGVRLGIGHLDENSFGEASTIAYVGYTPLDIFSVQVGGVVGLASGYVEDQLVLLGAVYITKEWKHAGINVLYNPAAVVVQLKLRFR